MSLTPASTLITFKDFKGQINKISHEEVKPNFASKCLNVLPLIKGVACKRNGFNVLTTQNAGSRITNLFTFERTIITEELIATLTALYKRNGVNLIAIKSDFTSSQKYCIINYNDNAIVLNGINYPQKYDGNTIGNVAGNPPIGYVGAVIQDRLWIIPTDTDEVDYSDPVNFESWPIYNKEVIYTTDGDINVSIIGHNGQPTIFKKHSLHVIYGDSPETFNIRQIQGSLGTVSHNTVRVVRGQAVRLAPDGQVWAWSGNQDTCVSDGLDFGINKDAIDKAVAWVDKRNFYWLAVPTGVSTEPNSLFVCDTVDWTWYPVSVPWNTSYIGNFAGELTLGRVDGLLNIETNGAYGDDGANINCYWESQWINLSPNKQINIGEMMLEADGGQNIDFTWTNEANLSTTESLVMDAANIIDTQVIDVADIFKLVKFKFGSNNNNQGMRVYSLAGECWKLPI